jgi:O-antigen/teichoic acid export membrane protein
MHLVSVNLSGCRRRSSEISPLRGSIEMSGVRVGMLRATTTLLAGGVVAQLLPLLLGPWLTRLYTPEDFGQFTVFATVSAALAVVVCARYEFALPLAVDDIEARDLMALCLRVWMSVVILSMVLALGLGLAGAMAHWAWLPLSVAAAGGVQWLTLWSNRAQRFSAMTASRITQHGGGALAQIAGGVSQLGGLGLVAGPILSSLAALAWLRHPAPLGGWRGLWKVPQAACVAIARKHRDFPTFNMPHAFSGALGDALTVFVLVAWTGDAGAGFWGLALRYLKAPATLVGSAVSQSLYPHLAHMPPDVARTAVRRLMSMLALLALPMVLTLILAGPALFAFAFGERWRTAGELARALAPYIGVHFVASPLAVVSMAWGAQAWALRMALLGMALFLLALVLGLLWDGLIGGAWAVSAAAVLYFGWYFWSLATWKDVPHAAAP